MSTGNTKTCSSCGGVCDINDEYCGRCGKRLVGAMASYPTASPGVFIPMNKTQAAVCQVDNCGIPPIGRCATCGLAFCLTHQAWDVYGTLGQAGRYVDMCAPCFAVKMAEEAKRREEAEAPLSYFRWGAARAALLASRVQPVKIYRIERRREWKAGLFGLGGQDVEVVTASPFGHGWILGKFRWEYSVTIHIALGPTEYKDVVESWLTALLDVSHDDPGWYNSPRFGRNEGLIRVQPYSGGYEALGLLKNDRFIGDEGCRPYTGPAWRGVEQAVKRLIGSSS